jgi:hypothetical protein
MELWLSFNNNEQRLRLPILPSSFQVEVGNLNTRVNINEIGNINLIGKSNLKEIVIESFFPAQEYYFVEYTGFPRPYECVEIIEAWRKSGRPIRLIITETNINLPIAIENFSYREKDGTGDVYYSLELAEYVFVGVKQDSKSYGYVQNHIRPAKEIPKTYVPKPNDTLITVAKKTTGNSANAKIIAERNQSVVKKNTIVKPEAGSTISAILQLHNTPPKPKQVQRGRTI